MNAKVVSLFLLVLMMSVTSLAAVNVDIPSNQTDSKLVLVRIQTTQSQVDLPPDIEIVASKSGEWVDIIIPDERLAELSSLNLEYEILIQDLLEYENSVRGSYHTLAQIESMLQSIASSYPSITSLYSIGTTYEGRNIWCLEITDNPGVDEGEPGVFYMGLHHAREWPTVEICLNIANQLTSQYGSNPDITDVVNNRRLWLVPCMNPDGYYYCHDQSHDWRKNRHYFPEYGTYGVDLNRNYAGSSDGNIWGAWGSIGDGSVSNYPDDEVYCGPGATSELETQAIRNLFLDNDICASITWHTYGEEVMWPWGYTYSSAPDNTYLSQVGQQIASRITSQYGGTYSPHQSSGLYPTTGDTTDWAYGYGYYVQGRATFAYTIEAGASFQPPASALDQICSENFDGALYFLQEAENIQDTVVPCVIPPVIDDMSTDDGNYVVSWQEQNPNANPDYFQLDEMTGLSVSTDDAEQGSGMWTLDGFSLSTARYQSSSHSYKSRSSNADVSSMTTTTPIPITSNMKLSFWCWYTTETNCDCAFVEVSRDGRYYELLDKFTGSSGGWVYKEYNLDGYADESIFIRFRYTTDAYTTQEGFYVDDINPVANFESIVTLSSSITNDYYEITDKPLGTYYYKVRGHNPTRGWGDFSTIESITVTENQNDPPGAPSIDGPASGKIKVKHDYILNAVDPEGDDVYYYVDWGDTTNSGWVGPYASGVDTTVSHTWAKKGTYIITAKAKDVNGLEGPSSTLEVTMPRSRAVIIRFLDLFPNAFPFLRLLLGR